MIKTGFRRLALVLAGVVLTLLLGLLLRWSAHPKAPVDVEDVARDWNATMGHLGIDSVYPPQEDFDVGDVFAIISDTGGAIPVSQALTGRAIKLAHVDMRADLEDVYGELPIFPDTLPRPSGADSAWPQAQGSESVFSATHRSWRALPLVMFPGFSVGHARKANVGLSWAESALNGLFGASGSSDDSVELRVPFAETYGVPSLLATGTLIQFCEDHKPACGDKQLRAQLSMLVGSKIWNKAVKVEVMLVDRVYLTRSLQEVHQSNSAIGAKLRLAAKLKEAETQLEAQKTAVAPGVASTDADKVNKLIDAQTQKLDDILKEASDGVPSGSLSVSNVDSSSIAISQTFPRPIAIGYRAIRRIPDPEEP